MTGREKINTTLAHKEPDKMAIDFGGTNDSAMHVSCIAALRDYYGLEKKPVEVIDVFTMAGVIDDDLAEILGSDAAPAYPIGSVYGFPRNETKEWVNLQGQTILVPKSYNPQPDGKGGYYVYPQGDLSCEPSGHMPAKSFYFDPVLRQQPFEEEDLDPSFNVEEWTILDDENLRYIKSQVDAAHKKGKAVVLAAPGMGLGDAADIPGCALKKPKGIRTYTDWYMSPILRPEYVRAVFEKQTEIALENLKRINDMMGNKIDVVFTCATDLSHQHGLFISPKIFDDLYMPFYKEANNWIHKHTNWKILKHNCGAIEPLIPRLIESGFDALNPVQCSADGMEPRHLKNEYGKDITFWGAGVNTQQTLPFGTQEEVREEVLERCEIFSKDGGFVFNTIHIVQANTPTENLVAMIDAIKEFNGER
jgi:hypothetical protein